MVILVWPKICGHICRSFNNCETSKSLKNLIKSQQLMLDLREGGFQAQAVSCQNRSWELEILTWGKGQQAHTPESFLQQVVPPGHIVCLSHFSSWTSDVRAGTFSTQGRDGRRADGWSQLSASRLQTEPWGQQWTWSSQQTAWQGHRVMLSLERVIIRSLLLYLPKNTCAAVLYFLVVSTCFDSRVSHSLKSTAAYTNNVHFRTRYLCFLII